LTAERRGDDVVVRGQRPERDEPVGQTDAAETGERGDVDQGRRRPEAARELDDDVSATGHDPRALTVVREEGERIVQPLWLKVLLPHRNGLRYGMTGASLTHPLVKVQAQD
jgi:hypothetical protein